MVLRLAKIGALGDPLRQSIQDVDNATLQTIEGTALYYALEQMMPNNSSGARKLGMFMGLGIAYNLLLSKVMSSESSGMGR